MSRRIVIEEPCEHDEIEEHYWMGYMGSDDHVCPGGSRTVITEPDYRAAAIEWIGDEPPDNYPGEWEQTITTVIEQTVRPLVDAALFGPEK